MALPTPKFAVYYGTITLNNGDVVTYTANEIATLYGVQAFPYLAVPLVGVSPFRGGIDEVSYIHLKPLPDGQYYDAQERYNTDYEVQLGEDFDPKLGGKWAERPRFVRDEDL